MQILRAIILVSLLIVIQSVMAENLYTGIAFGGSDSDQQNYNQPSSAKLYFGYKKNQYLGFETAAVYLGDFTLAESNGLTQRETSGLEFSVLGFYPLYKEFNIFTKAGFFPGKSKLKIKTKS